MQINTTGGTQLTTQAMSPTNLQNKSKKGTAAVKPKKADKKEGTAAVVVGEKENQPALTLKDLEIQVRSGVTRPQTAASTSRRVKSGKRESIDRELKE
jgi:Flp pilus assembly protein TadG